MTTGVTPPKVSRRGWLAASTGLALAGVGAGLTWRTSQRQNKALVDTISATLILQSYMHSTQNSSQNLTP